MDAAPGKLNRRHHHGIVKGESVTKLKDQPTVTDKVVIPWKKWAEHKPVSSGVFLTVIDGRMIEAKWDGSEWSDPTWLDFHGCGCCGGGMEDPTHWVEVQNPSG